jgi:hypothetical protein
VTTTTTLDTLKINYLTQAQYDAAVANNQINADELYLTPSSGSSYILPTAASNTLGGIKTGYTTSGNNIAVQVDGNGNAYIVQTDTNTYVTQNSDSTSTWRGILGTYNYASSAGTTPTSGATNVAYYNGTVMFNPNSGILYAGGDYYMGLATTDSLYSLINSAGWTSDVIV